MNGNVRKWCTEQCHSNYEGALEDVSAWIDEGTKGDNDDEKSRMLRGGSWGIHPAYYRSGYLAKHYNQ
jgi:formylglycine-generating enzyme required for sulfatase activity